MKIERFLEHHGISGDPFSEEDAQTDALFKTSCITSTHHPAWTKFFGSPSEPSTAIVFGEKGSGKTALRLQARQEIEAHNQAHPDTRAFLVEYDDFNPFLDRFLAAVPAPDVSEALRRWRTRDHMDAILALSITRLVDEILPGTLRLDSLSDDQRRDLLLLAALYDQSTSEPTRKRWHRLRRLSRFRYFWSRRDLQLAVLMIAAIALLLAAVPWFRKASVWPILLSVLLIPLANGAWRLLRSELTARDIKRGLRVLSRDPRSLRSFLTWFDSAELAAAPLPTASSGSSEERYELLRKLLGLLKSLQYQGIIVLIDRVDEPQAIGGDPRKMRALIWPLLDHKLLRHPGLGVKLLLPIELAYYLEKEEKEFYDRARPDKLNMIKPLRWTGASLYDLATARLQACASKPAEASTRLRDLISPGISDDHLKDALGYLRTPRQLFKFLHKLIEEHCHRHTDDDPSWTIDADTFRMVYAAHIRELEAFDRGFGHG